MSYVVCVNYTIHEECVVLEQFMPLGDFGMFAIIVIIKSM